MTNYGFMISVEPWLETITEFIAYGHELWGLWEVGASIWLPEIKGENCVSRKKFGLATISLGAIAIYIM